MEHDLHNVNYLRHIFKMFKLMFLKHTGKLKSYNNLSKIAICLLFLVYQSKKWFKPKGLLSEDGFK